MHLSIIIPAHNEEKRIGLTLKEYSDYFSKIPKSQLKSYEILVVINNTKDSTEEIVKQYQKLNKNIKYLNLPRGGKGYAVLQGFNNALQKDYDLIGFVDADNATSPSAFYELVKNIKSHDGVIASRYIKGSVVTPKQSFSRIAVSRIFNIWIRSLLFMQYRDTQCGAKLFRKNVIEKAIPHLTMSQWAFDVELLYVMKKQRFKIVEVPTVWGDKEYSKINFVKAGPKMALSILRLRLIHSPFKKIVYFYDVINKKNK